MKEEDRKEIKQQTSNKKEEASKNSNYRVEILLTTLLIVFFIIAVYLKLNYTINIVWGDSMCPTLQENDLVLTKRISFDGLEDQDIIIVNANEVKELEDIAATNGGDIYLIKRYYADKSTGGIYVEGDNKEVSMDSRDFGELSKQSLYGKVILDITQTNPKLADILMTIYNKLGNIN